MKYKKTALYVGNFSFPYGNASGKRVYANGKILRELGYDVIYIGTSDKVENQINLINTKNVYDGFIYYNFPYPCKKIDWLKYKQNYNELLTLIKEENIIESLNLVIYYGSPTLSFFNTKLIKYCVQNNIKVVADCVDWLTVKTNNPFFNLIKWADNTYQKAYVNIKADAVIAISRYLSEYYEKAGLETIIIPPLSSEYKIETLDLSKQHRRIITYAGQPFRKGIRLEDLALLKDRIDKTIILLYHAKNNGCDFIFNIYGFTKEEYLFVIPSHNEYIEALGDNICFNGLVPNNVVVDRVMKSDFTILIRDINRDTTAGFPTKVSESISCGTPVITTRTSDLELYITEGINGFFLNNINEFEDVSKLISILSLQDNEISLMKNNCKESKLFDYKSYISEFDDFINKIL